MRGIVFHGPSDVRVETIPDPALRDPRGAIVRVTQASICGSDLHVLHGAVPAEPGVVIGHECVGVIEDAGKEWAEKIEQDFSKNGGTIVVMTMTKISMA